LNSLSCRSTRVKRTDILPSPPAAAVVACLPAPPLLLPLLLCLGQYQGGHEATARPVRAVVRATRQRRRRALSLRTAGWGYRWSRQQRAAVIVPGQ
jgi:hypothetical protein